MQGTASRGRYEEGREAGCWWEVEGCCFWHQLSSLTTSPCHTRVLWSRVKSSATRYPQAHSTDWFLLYSPIPQHPASYCHSVRQFPASYTALGGVQHSALLPTSPHVCKDLQKISNPLQLVCYIYSLITASLRLLRQQRGGTGWSWGTGKLFTQPMLQEGQLLSQTKLLDLIWLLSKCSCADTVWFAILCKKGHLSSTCKHGNTQRTPITGRFYASLALHLSPLWAGAAACTQPIPAGCRAPQGTPNLAASRAVPGSPTASSSHQHVQNRAKKMLGTDAAKLPLQHSSSTF